MPSFNLRLNNKLTGLVSLGYLPVRQCCMLSLFLYVTSSQGNLQTAKQRSPAVSESIFDFEQVVAFPIEDVWQAMKRTSELDVLGGQKVIERVSDSEWTCALDESNTTRCVASYDEATHTVTVILDSATKHADDTTTISASETDGGTLVHVKTCIHGGFIVKALLKLVGKGAYDKASASIVSNIVAICEGRPTSILSQEEINEFVADRVKELHKDKKDE